MIEMAAVSFAYNRVRVLDRVDLSLAGGLTLLVGANGCGKSTLLKLAAGVERPDAGRVTIDGRDAWSDEVEARRRLVYVPEHPDLSPYASLVEVLRLVCRLRGEPIARADDVLAAVGLGNRARASVRELSAGQRRRALLAAAWIGTARVALLDEPLESLDRELRDRVLAWIRDLAAAGSAVVVVSHQIEPFLDVAARVLTVRDGRLVGPVTLPASAADRRELVERFSRGSGSLEIWKLNCQSED